MGNEYYLITYILKSSLSGETTTTTAIDHPIILWLMGMQKDRNPGSIAIIYSQQISERDYIRYISGE